MGAEGSKEDVNSLIDEETGKKKKSVMAGLKREAPTGG